MWHAQPPDLSPILHAQHASNLGGGLPAGPGSPPTRGTRCRPSEQTSDRVSRRDHGWRLHKVTAYSPAISAAGLGVIDLKTGAYGSGNRLEITPVRAHYQVVPTHRSLNDACINDVGGRGTSSEGADRASLVIIESLDIAPGKEPSQESLAASSAPGLGHDRRGNRGHFPAREESAMTGPQTAFPPVSGNECTGVVGDAH
jgi:hypothetical protein